MWNRPAQGEVNFMTDNSTQSSSAEILMELGLQQYEARCFVALTRLSAGTAREISEVADVPRTRVYDAVEELEAEGLVDVHHSSPKRFRAIPVAQAVSLLRQRFDQRFENLLSGLEALEGVEAETPTSAPVWTTSGRTAVDGRAIELLDAATDEIILVVNDGETTSNRILKHLREASDRGVAVLVGTLTETAAERIQAAVPDVQFLKSELDWLRAPEDFSDEAVLGRIVVCDRSAVLLSSLNGTGAGAGVGVGEQHREHALWCDDIGNGLVLIVRRLLLAQLSTADGHRKR